MAEAGERIPSIVADTDHDEVAKQVSAEGPREVITDKGYHSRAVVCELAEWGCARIAREPNRGRQHGMSRSVEQQAVYANRRRISWRARPADCLRQRGEKLVDGIITYMIAAWMRRVAFARPGKYPQAAGGALRARPISVPSLMLQTILEAAYAELPGGGCKSFCHTAKAPNALTLAANHANRELPAARWLGATPIK